MQSDLTVACVLKIGGDYDAEYVERLRDGVAANLTGHRFVCLSDVDVPCERVPLVQDWPGWWSKLELFQHLTGPTLYFDLDTVITGPLDELAACAWGFAMLRDFAYPQSFASGVMAWSGDHGYLAEGFTLEAAASYCVPGRWGDQGWIAERADPRPLQAEVPGQIVSRKYGLRHPKEERVVCFHGLPRPRDVGWKV